MSNSDSEKKYTPRYAKTAEELVFYTDTKEADYPVYLLPSNEVRLKKRPTDVERFATFHLKSIEVIEKCDPERNIIVDILVDAEKRMTIDDYVASYPQLPLSTIIQTIRDLGVNFHLRTFKLVYEVYKGDYSEFVAEAPATVVMLYIVPPYGLRSTTTDQKFAITYTTLKRLLSKLPPDVSSIVQKIAYVDKLSTHRYILPIIKIKFCLPSPELSRAFDEVKKWLEGVEETQVAEESEEEEPQPQIEIEIPEIPVKPRELEVELTQSTSPSVEQPKEQPQKSELVKLYLLSMRLPSKYLVQKIEIKEGEEVRKWEGIAKDIASRLEGIRRKAYDEISRIFAHAEEFGTWIAVSEKAVEEARKLSEWIRDELSSLPISQVKKNIDLDSLYSVRAVPIYLEPDDAKGLLNAAIARLSADVEELERRIREAEEQQKKTALKRLETDLNYRKALLEAFRRFLNSI